VRDTNGWAARLAVWALGLFAASTMGLTVYTFTCLRNDLNEQKSLLQAVKVEHETVKTFVATTKEEVLEIKGTAKMLDSRVKKNYLLTKRLARKLAVPIPEEED
jgi:hypothetical protein